jgi:hypothetical protein
MLEVIFTLPKMFQRHDPSLELRTPPEIGPTIHLAINHTQKPSLARQKSATGREEATEPSQLLHLDLPTHWFPSYPHNRCPERLQYFHEESGTQDLEATGSH